MKMRERCHDKRGKEMTTVNDLLDHKSDNHKLVRWYVSSVGSKWIIKPVYINLETGQEFSTFVSHVSERFDTKREATAEKNRRNKELT